MKEEFFYPSSDGKTKIHAIAWKPEGKVKAVYQIVHGMVEFVNRYDEFASFLCGHGFYVVGNDHLGHGQSVTTKEDWGYFAKKESVDCVIQDILYLMHETKKQYPDVPYVIMGHSMGSFFTRKFSYMYGKELDAVIIMGTGNQSRLLQVTGKALAKVLKLIYGERHRSKLMAAAMFGAYNKRIKHPKTVDDWLTKDARIVDIYRHEPANQFLFTINGIETLLNVIGDVTKQKNVDKMKKDVPMLFVSGEADPVGEYGKAVKRAYQMYVKNGQKDVTLHLFPEDRHEILNEIDRPHVYAYILKWLTKKIPLEK